MQKSNPSAGVEAIATSVELFGRDAGFARRAKEQHARREADKLPTAHCVLVARRVHSESQAGTQGGAECTPHARWGRLQRKDALSAGGLQVYRIERGKAELHAGFRCRVGSLASCAGRVEQRLLWRHFGTGFGRGCSGGCRNCGGGVAPTPSPASATPAATPRCRSAHSRCRCC